MKNTIFNGACQSFSDTIGALERRWLGSCCAARFHSVTVAEKIDDQVD